jgi:hypothetical protein
MESDTELDRLLPLGLAAGDSVETDAGRPATILKVKDPRVLIRYGSGHEEWTYKHRVNYRPSLEEIARRAAICRGQRFCLDFICGSVTLREAAKVGREI